VRFIGGKTTFSASNETIPVYDPATGKVVRELTQSTAVNRDGFVAGAEGGFTANKVSCDSHDVASLNG
jgi:malonate-semialdehyde dehydrogenase (acetylating)/methylmalonate-semialdehyde dehydrogenase